MLKDKLEKTQEEQEGIAILNSYFDLPVNGLLTYMEQQTDITYFHDMKMRIYAYMTENQVQWPQTLSDSDYTVYDVIYAVLHNRAKNNRGTLGLRERGGFYDVCSTYEREEIIMSLLLYPFYRNILVVENGKITFRYSEKICIEEDDAWALAEEPEDNPFN